MTSITLGYETISLANVWHGSLKFIGKNENKVMDEENYGVLGEAVSSVQLSAGAKAPVAFIYS